MKFGNKICEVVILISSTIYASITYAELTNTGIYSYDMATRNSHLLIPGGGGPDTDGRYVVWEGWGGGSFYAYDTITGITHTVPGLSSLAFFNRPRLSIDDGKIVYANTNGEESEIILYDITTGAQKVIVPLETGEIYRIRISGDWVVWDNGFRNSFNAFNISTNEHISLYESGAFVYWPDVSGNIAVYTKSYGSAGITGYDFRTHSEFRISDWGSDVQIDGDLVVWEYAAGIFGLNLSTGEAMTIEPIWGGSFRPRIDGNIVLYEYDPHSLRGYDTLNESYFLISDNSTTDIGWLTGGEHYAVGGSLIVFYGGEWVCPYGVNFMDFAIFAANWYGPGSNSYTIPKGEVVVDGNISEWSENVEWIALDKVYYVSPNDVGEARFALKWDESTNKIYVAVIVEDFNHVFRDDYGTFSASDRLELCSQGDAAGGSYWTNQDIAQQYIIAPDTNSGSWATLGFGEPNIAGTDLEYAVKVKGDLIIYEAGVKQFDNYGGLSGGETIVTDLHAGHVVRFDVVADTRWSDTGFGMLSENTMLQKFKNADHIAQYTLVEQSERPPCLELKADLDRNCIVNFKDLALFCDDWLLSQSP